MPFGTHTCIFFKLINFARKITTAATAFVAASSRCFGLGFRRQNAILKACRVLFRERTSYAELIACSFATVRRTRSICVLIAPSPRSRLSVRYQSALAYIATEGQGEALCRLHWLRFSCFGFAIRGRRRREKVSGRGGDLPFFLATPVCSELKCIQLDGGLRAELSCFCSA